MHIDVDYFKTMYAYETDEEDTEEHILQRVVKLEARLSRRNLQIREALAIAAIERADDYLALLRQQRQQHDGLGAHPIHLGPGGSPRPRMNADKTCLDPVLESSVRTSHPAIQEFCRVSTGNTADRPVQGQMRQQHAGNGAHSPTRPHLPGPGAAPVPG